MVTREDRALGLTKGPFKCDVRKTEVNVWGPYTVLLRATADGVVYSNLKPEADGRAVMMYHDMLDFAVAGCITAHLMYKTEFRNPDIIGAKFLRLLISNGVDLPRVAQLNKEEKSSLVCHTHDFCDANMVMLEAMRDLVGERFDLTEDADALLWNASWEAFAKRLQLLHPN